MTDGRTTSETLHEFVDVLREKNHEQQQALLDLLGVLKREREALAEGQPELLPGLLTELQEVSSRAMRAEAQRDAAATKLAGVLGCRPVLREICEALPEGEAARLNDQAEGLIAAVSGRDDPGAPETPFTGFRHGGFGHHGLRGRTLTGLLFPRPGF
jgi:hypothetical protein